MDVFKFSSSGSEAIEVAFKIARQYHRQTGAREVQDPVPVLELPRRDLGAMGATGLPQFRVKFEPMPGGFVHFPRRGSTAAASPVAARRATSRVPTAWT